MIIFNKFKKKDKIKKILPEIDRALFENIFKQLNMKTKIPSISLTAVRTNDIPLTSCKLGGSPYLPKDFEYPRNSNGLPLKLLAQLNFAELPKLEHFPKDGILQFYILHDDMMGLDDDLTQQNNFRVIFHKEILSLNMLRTDFSELELIQIDNNSYSFDCFPFGGEFILTGEITNQVMTSMDYRHRILFEKLCKEDYYLEKFTDDGLTEKIYDLFLNEEFDFDIVVDQEVHLINGYPTFSQHDPRGYDIKNKYDTLLFQLVSQPCKELHKWEILWGDAGVGNFFINIKNLKKCNFADVLYTWDCY